MYRNLINISSNVYSKLNIDKARRMLSFSYPDINFTKSAIIVPASDAEGMFPFRNILGLFYSDESREEIARKLKTIEFSLGKTHKDRETGKVVIEIDLLQHGDKVLRQQDFEKEYVQDLLREFDEAPE